MPTRISLCLLPDYNVQVGSKTGAEGDISCLNQSSHQGPIQNARQLLQ